ncbi:MAG: hypothetical protein WDO74_08400 [Pseudomonadota bacterium]
MAGRFVREIRAVCLLSGLLLGLACRKTPEPTGADSGVASQASASPAPHAPPTSSALPPVEITWVDPPGLRRVPPKSAMRKASYEVPRANGDTEDGELAVFYFGPGQGGSIDANVDRWVKQFSGLSPSDVKRADREANGLRQHTVEIQHGTFDAGQMAMSGSKGPKKDYALEGAIVETPSGAYFFKMTGPARTVLAARAPFLQLLDSVRAGH